jgi:hypothetical protein
MKIDRRSINDKNKNTPDEKGLEEEIFEPASRSQSSG